MPQHSTTNTTRCSIPAQEETLVERIQPYFAARLPSHPRAIAPPARDGNPTPLRGNVAEIPQSAPPPPPQGEFHFVGYAGHNNNMSCHVISCHVMSCHVMSCHVMSCHVMSCHVMSCHVMSCHVMSWRGVVQEFWGAGVTTAWTLWPQGIVSLCYAPWETLVLIRPQQPLFQGWHHWPLAT